MSISYSSSFGSSTFGSSFFPPLGASCLGASTTGADEAADMFSSSGILNPLSNARAAMFLKLFAMMIGTVASIGYPAEREIPAMFLIPSWNLERIELGSRLMIS